MLRRTFLKLLGGLPFVELINFPHKKPVETDFIDLIVEDIERKTEHGWKPKAVLVNEKGYEELEQYLGKEGEEKYRWVLFIRDLPVIKERIFDEDRPQFYVTSCTSLKVIRI